MPVESLNNEVIPAFAAIDVHYMVYLTEFVPNRYRGTIVLDFECSQLGFSSYHNLVFFLVCKIDNREIFSLSVG